MWLYHLHELRQSHQDKGFKRCGTSVLPNKRCLDSAITQIDFFRAVSETLDKTAELNASEEDERKFIFNIAIEVGDKTHHRTGIVSYSSSSHFKMETFLNL